MAKATKGRTTGKSRQRRRAAGTRRGQAPKAAPSSKIATTWAFAKQMAAAAPGAKRANTIIFVHGIGNKPTADVLKCQWDTALLGGRLGDRSRMAYWVNRQYYPDPIDTTCGAGDLTAVAEDEASNTAIMAVASGRSGDEELILDQEINALTSDESRRRWLTRVADKMALGASVDAAALAPGMMKAKILPLPPFLRRLITRRITRIFLRDVNDFFFDADRRDLMQDSLIERLQAGGGPFVVIGHSQGSMIAYNVLRQLKKADCDVPLFVTIGSPLGLDEVQDVLRQWTGGRLPFPPCVDRWVNVAERLDPVALDNDLSGEFDGEIVNCSGLLLNPDAPEHPHSGTGYLQTDVVQQEVRNALDLSFQQALARFVVAKDLVGDLENGRSLERHPVLIQLASDRPEAAANPALLDDIAVKVENKINELVKVRDPGSAPNIDRMRHFIAADLTRFEVEALRSVFKELQIESIWRNASKRALINDSTNTVQAYPANIGYGADGKGICWAVLDTGIRADHPQFAEFDNVARQWDCTGNGQPRELQKGSSDFEALDKNGHGTHVSAIIAGRYGFAAADGRPAMIFSGMAPRCTLYGFKVLDDRGGGRDSSIVKALDKISGINEAAGKIVIHGVNLSLGGSFDPSVFGCGHTPLCQELRRLWRQGVLVCLAAGNEGYVVLRAESGTVEANMDLSIGDPANLDEAVAVGSVHKTNPHTYGISFFSSRGPTADGRRKPDLVAPGERILSARHDWAGKNAPRVQDLYVEMSGTSMATPHVSGLLAAFLSLRREFIGYPERTKTILLDSCVDLGRDIYMQGAGLPNLIKMLALH